MIALVDLGTWTMLNVGLNLHPDVMPSKVVHDVTSQSYVCLRDQHMQSHGTHA